MNLESIVKNIYNKLNNAKYIIKDWAIIDELRYKEIKNKITITGIGSLEANRHNEITCILESKRKFYYIKWSDKFISLAQGESEYKLLLQVVNIFAVNINAILNTPNKKLSSLKEILQVIGFKLNKKAKQDLEFFT